MNGKKIYSFRKSEIFNTLYDIIEMQKGEMIFCDTREGKMLYQLTMYDCVWELLYNITEVSPEMCEVVIRASGERKNVKREILRQFSLLDSMLYGECVSVEFSDIA